MVINPLLTVLCQDVVERATSSILVNGLILKI
jgi:hypothetical protein